MKALQIFGCRLLPKPDVALDERKTQEYEHDEREEPERPNSLCGLFVNASTTTAIYGNVMRLWLVPPLLVYWSTRIWMKAHRDEVHDDPLVFALRDPHSLVVLALSGLLFWGAR